MRITWIIAGPLTARNGRIQSAQASTRYRCLIPAEVLMARGHQLEFIRTDTLAGVDSVDDADFGDVVIFAKSFHRINERLAERARALGRRVVVDYCDLDFQTDTMLRDHRANMARLADCVVAASESLADAIAGEFGGAKPRVISDPYELPAGTARFAPASDVVNLVWYGHPANISDVMGTMDRLADLGGAGGIGRRLSLSVVSGPIGGLADAFAAANRKFDGRLHLSFTEWSVDAVAAALAAADIALLPTASDRKANAKSANRVVEALRAGRFVVASPIAAYIPFGDFVRLDADVVSGLRWVLEQGGGLENRIRSGQDYIERFHSPSAIADRWDDVIAADRH